MLIFMIGKHLIQYAILLQTSTTSFFLAVKQQINFNGKSNTSHHTLSSYHRFSVSESLYPHLQWSSMA